MTQFMDETLNAADGVEHNRRPISDRVREWPVDAPNKLGLNFYSQRRGLPKSRRDIRLFEGQRFRQRMVLRLCRTTTWRVSRAPRHQ
jgi:hypothetical protein